MKCSDQIRNKSYFADFSEGFVGGTSFPESDLSSIFLFLETGALVSNSSRKSAMPSIMEDKIASLGFEEIDLSSSFPHDFSSVTLVLHKTFVLPTGK